MDMDLLIELAVRAVKAYLEQEGITAPAEKKIQQKSALILTEDHCGDVCSVEKFNSELCKVDCALSQNYEVNLDDYDSIVLFDMTNSNLFKIANGCTDNKFLALAAEAILKGKRVLMVKDDVEILKYEGTKAKALYNNIYKNLQILLDSGVELVAYDDINNAICDGVVVEEEPAKEPEKAATETAKKENSGDSVLVIEKRVITERDIRAAAAQHYTKIQLPEKPVITYLAKDTAFDLGIELI